MTAILTTLVIGGTITAITFTRKVLMIIIQNNKK